MEESDAESENEHSIAVRETPRTAAQLKSLDDTPASSIWDEDSDVEEEKGDDSEDAGSDEETEDEEHAENDQVRRLHH
jgi:hypothetical protein